MKQGWQAFPSKGQVAKISGITGLALSATPLGHRWVKAAIGNIRKRVWLCSNNILLTKADRVVTFAWGPLVVDPVRQEVQSAGGWR